MLEALFENREQSDAEIEVLSNLGARRFAIGAEIQILFHGEARKQTAALSHHRDPEFDNFLRPFADQVVNHAINGKGNGAGTRQHQTSEAFHQRAFAVAVSAEQGNGLTLHYRDRHAFERAHRAIAGRQTFDFEFKPQDKPSARPDS